MGSGAQGSRAQCRYLEPKRQRAGGPLSRGDRRTRARVRRDPRSRSVRRGFCRDTRLSAGQTRQPHRHHDDHVQLHRRRADDRADGGDGGGSNAFVCAGIEKRQEQGERAGFGELWCQRDGAFADGTIGRWLEESLAVFDAFCRGRQVVVGSSMVRPGAGFNVDPATLDPHAVDQYVAKARQLAGQARTSTSSPLASPPITSRRTAGVVSSALKIRDPHASRVDS